ncbi:Glycosyltransferase [Entamoeba marina]
MVGSTLTCLFLYVDDVNDMNQLIQIDSLREREEQIQLLHEKHNRIFYFVIHQLMNEKYSLPHRSYLEKFYHSIAVSILRLNALTEYNDEKFTTIPDECDGRIGIVWTYVNGSDPEWISQYERYYKKYESMRYQDYETLRYSMRSAFQHAPFIHDYYLVVSTLSQVPYYIKDFKELTNNNDEYTLHIVTHDQFIDSQYLPTFNSVVIESFLYKIKGLSECFVYLNDDYMFGDTIQPSDLFTSDGKPFLFKKPMFTPSISWDKHQFDHSISNANALLNNYYHQSEYLRRPYFTHTVFVWKKQVFKQIEDHFSNELHTTRLNKKRTMNDIQIGMLHDGVAVEERYGYIRYLPLKRSSYVSIKSNEDSINEALQTARSRIRFMCFNDNFSQEGEENIQLVNMLRNGLEKIYSTKTPFEK